MFSFVTKSIAPTASNRCHNTRALDFNGYFIDDPISFVTPFLLGHYVCHTRLMIVFEQTVELGIVVVGREFHLPVGVEFVFFTDDRGRVFLHLEFGRLQTCKRLVIDSL